MVVYIKTAAMGAKIRRHDTAETPFSLPSGGVVAESGGVWACDPLPAKVERAVAAAMILFLLLAKTAMFSQSGVVSAKLALRRDGVANFVEVEGAFKAVSRWFCGGCRTGELRAAPCA